MLLKEKLAKNLKDKQKDTYYLLLVLKEKITKGVEFMEIEINGKIIKDTDFNGNTELLLEEIVYQSLNENDVVMMERLRLVFNFLLNYTKAITNNIFTPPYNFNDVKTDRDKLELVIEQYKLTKYMVSGGAIAKKDYVKYLEDLEQYEVFSKDKAIMTMIDYKIARFSNEIFEEMGVKIIDRLDNGAVILQDMGLYKN